VTSRKIADLTLPPVAGYSAPLRHRIMTRWMEQKEQAKTPALPNLHNPAEAARAWAVNIGGKTINVSPGRAPLVSPAYRWLFIEALLPLFGAAVLFSSWGLVRKLSNNGGLTYDWMAAIDPVSWLYGGSILAFQAGLKGVDARQAGVLPFACFVAAAISILILMAAMNERGQDAGWKPPRRLTVTTVLLVAGILIASFRVQAIVLESKTDDGNPKTQQQGTREAPQKGSAGGQSPASAAPARQEAAG